MQIDPIVASPFDHFLIGELQPVVYNDFFRLGTIPPQSVEDIDDTRAGQVCCYFDRHAFSTEIVDGI